jgi:hypothetical protein
MAQLTRLGLYGGPRTFRTFAAAPANVIVTGTALTATEADIVTGGKTIILTLANDTWVTAGATFNAQRQNIIDGLDSAGVEATGWNAEVRDKEVVGAVERTSDTVVTITLTAAAAYDITANETVTVTIPATALTTTSSDFGATPTFSITFVPVVTSVPGGVGKYSKKRNRYPRRVYIDGKAHWVSSPEEERQLLEARRDRLIEALREEDSPAPKLKKQIVKVERRIDNVAEREKAWLQKLYDEDEEILLLM